MVRLSAAILWGPAPAGNTSSGPTLESWRLRRDIESLCSCQFHCKKLLCSRKNLRNVPGCARCSCCSVGQRSSSPDGIDGAEAEGRREVNYFLRNGNNEDLNRRHA